MERAPEAVRRLYEAGDLGLETAAAFGTTDKARAALASQAAAALTGDPTHDAAACRAAARSWKGAVAAAPVAPQPAAARPRLAASAAVVPGLAALLDVLALTLRENNCSETLAFAFDHVPGEHTVTITARAATPDAAAAFAKNLAEVLSARRSL